MQGKPTFHISPSGRGWYGYMEEKWCDWSLKYRTNLWVQERIGKLKCEHWTVILAWMIGTCSRDGGRRAIDEALICHDWKNMWHWMPEVADDDRIPTKFGNFWSVLSCTFIISASVLFLNSKTVSFLAFLYHLILTFYSLLKTSCLAFPSFMCSTDLIFKLMHWVTDSP